MNNIAFIILLFFALMSCSTKTANSKNFDKNRVSGLKVYYEIPFEYDSTGEPVKYEQFYVKIFKLDKFYFYELPFNYQEKINGVENEEQRKYVFVFHTDSLYGTNINKWNLLENRQLKVDSFLKSETFSTLNVEQNLNRLNLNLLSREDDSSKGEVVRKYKLTSKSDTNDVTIGFFYYTKHFFSNIPYSFSEEFDNITGFKLHKIEFNPIVRSLASNKSAPKFRFTLLMNEEVVDIKELLYYLEIYKGNGLHKNTGSNSK